MARRIVIIDSAVRNRFGHFFVHTKSLSEACQQLGHDIITFVSHECDDSAEELRAERMLSFPAWGNAKLSMFSYAALWANANMVVNDSLGRISARLRSDDLILMHTVSPNELFGIYRWYMSLPSPKPKLFMCIHAAAPYYAAAEDEEIAQVLFGHACRSWTTLIAEKGVALTTTNKILSDIVWRSSGYRPPLMPIIVPENQIVSKSRTSELSFLFSGFLNEKGIGHLIKALQICSVPEVKFVLHIANKNIADQCRQHLVDVRNTHIISNALDQSSYNSMVSDADALILPYNPTAYKARHSAMFFEALTAGKPLLVTAPTPMSEELISQGLPGVVVEDWTPTAIAFALNTLYRDFDIRRSIAEQVSRIIKNNHTAGAYLVKAMSLMRH